MKSHVPVYSTGPLSDKYGRKKISVVALILLVPAVSLGGLVPNVEFYTFLRLVTYVCIR
jgi:MFS family permease